MKRAGAGRVGLGEGEKKWGEVAKLSSFKTAQPAVGQPGRTKQRMFREKRISVCNHKGIRGFSALTRHRVLTTRIFSCESHAQFSDSSLSFSHTSSLYPRAYPVLWLAPSEINENLIICVPDTLRKADLPPVLQVRLQRAIQEEKKREKKARKLKSHQIRHI